jgi:hypothetical protein
MDPRIRIRTKISWFRNTATGDDEFSTCHGLHAFAKLCEHADKKTYGTVFIFVGRAWFRSTSAMMWVSPAFWTMIDLWRSSPWTRLGFTNISIQGCGSALI